MFAINALIWLAIILGSFFGVWLLSGHLLFGLVGATVPTGFYLWRVVVGIGTPTGHMASWNRQSTGIPLGALILYSEENDFSKEIEYDLLLSGVASSWACSSLFGAIPEKLLARSQVEKSVGPFGIFLKSSIAQSGGLFSAILGYYMIRPGSPINDPETDNATRQTILLFISSLSEFDLMPLYRIGLSTSSIRPRTASHWGLAVTPILFGLVRPGTVPNLVACEDAASDLKRRTPSKSMSIGDVVRLCPGLALPRASEVLNRSTSGWTTVRAMRSSLADTALGAEAEALACGVELVTFLDELLNCVQDAYAGVSMKDVLAHLKAAGAVQNDLSRVPVSVGPATWGGLRGLDADIKAAARLVGVR